MTAPALSRGELRRSRRRAGAERPRPSRSGRHRTDIPALLFGLLFLLTGAVGLWFAFDWVRADHGVWLGIVLAAAGMLGLIVVVVDRLSTGRGTDDAGLAHPWTLDSAFDPSLERTAPVDTSMLDMYDLTVPYEPFAQQEVTRSGAPVEPVEPDEPTEPDDAMPDRLTPDPTED